MAETKRASASDEQNVEYAEGGVDVAGQPKRSEDLSHAELKKRLAYQPDAEHHPSSLKREADKTSAPSALDAESHDPPVRTAKPAQGIRTLASGAGAHEPPPADEFDADGRAKYDRAAAGNRDWDNV